MTPVTFDSFRDTHPPARTNANWSGLDHEKESNMTPVTFVELDHRLEPREGYTRYHACTSRNPGHVMELVTIFD